MIVSLIAALSEERAIGLHNRLPWHLPDDTTYYQQAIRGYVIIMGRKTAESEDMYLSERRNLLVTRQEDYARAGFEIYPSLHQALQSCRDEKEVFVTGGSEIYAQAMPFAHRLYLTHVHASVQGDSFFPEFDYANWQTIWENYHSTDDRHAYPFTFRVYERTTLPQKID
jgi:dihydrofolate reductase